MKPILYTALAFSAIFIGMRIGGDILRMMPVSK